MDEHFQFAIGRGADCAHIVQRKLARQHHARDAKALRQRHPFGTGDAHLRAAVEFDIGQNAARQLGNADVLHNQRVDARAADGLQRLRCAGQFMVKNQRVEGEVAAHAAPVERLHDLRQFVQSEAHLGARRKVREAEVDGVGACFHGSVHLRPIAGRAHNLGLLGQRVVSLCTMQPCASGHSLGVLCAIPPSRAPVYHRPEQA